MTKAKANKSNTKEVLKTKNEGYGFYGTTCIHYRSTVEQRWEEAFITLLEISKMSPERIRRYLDSKAGRWLADACYDKKTSPAETIKNRWQHPWYRRDVFDKAYTVSDEEFYEE